MYMMTAGMFVEYKPMLARLVWSHVKICQALII